jgi:hypothetical protein
MLCDHVPIFMQRLAAEVGLQHQCNMELWADVSTFLDCNAQCALELYAADALARKARFPVRMVSFADGAYSPVGDLAPAVQSGVTVAFDGGVGRMHLREAFVTDVGIHMTALAQQQLDLPSFGDVACVFCETPCADDITAGDHVCDFWAMATTAVCGAAERRAVLVRVQELLFEPEPHMPVPRVCMEVVTPQSMLLGIVAAVDLLVHVLVPGKRKRLFPSAFALPPMVELPVSMSSLERVLQHYRPLLADAPPEYQHGLFASMVAFASSVARAGGVMQRQPPAILSWDPPALETFRAQLYVQTPSVAPLEAFVASMRKGKMHMLAAERFRRAAVSPASLATLVSAVFAPAHEKFAGLLRRGVSRGVGARGATAAPTGQPCITKFALWGAQEALGLAAANPQGREAAFFGMLGALGLRFATAQRRFFARTLRLSQQDLQRASEDEHVLMRVGFLAHWCACGWHTLGPRAQDRDGVGARLVTTSPASGLAAYNFVSHE